MIHLVEGADGVGKTTFALHLAERLRIPYVEDLGRADAVAAGATGPELDVAQYSYLRLLEQLARAGVDLVVDRAWVSAIVYNRSRPGRPPLPDYLENPASRARMLGACETLYHVEVSYETSIKRIRARGEDFEPKELVRDIYHFSAVFDEIEKAGVRVIRISGESGLI